MTTEKLIKDIAKQYARLEDIKIYRIISGEFDLRKDGELDMRFKKNKRLREEDLKNDN